MDLNTDFLSNVSVSVKFCHYITQKPDWSEKKTKTAYTIWYVREGSFMLELNDRQDRVTAGDIIFFYPGCSYSAHANGEKSGFLYISFALETGSHIDLLAGENYSGIYRRRELTEAAELFWKTNESVSKVHGSIDFLQYMAFMGFFSVLAPLFGQQQPFYKAIQKPTDTRIYRALSYIREFFLEPLTNAELAAYMGMSEKYFIRFFSAQVGKSPMRYLQEYRMQHSLVLLADPTNTLSEIAQQLGFNDQFSFSKAFKHYFGDAPSVIRKQLAP